ncbi:MAG: hypothetical protein DRJ66_02745 [Thermoprotei archaeon]|nr:MAG: hypothetical protein DRJ66_02745 [Thermoprotei archaeon]RLF20140.1 MAG: hypothetical protein DRZ82_03370 [Thermoprotei archaeon]
MYVPLRKALEDFLKQFDLTVEDILDAMDESKEGAIESLRRRAHLTERDIRFIEQNFTSRDINLLVFAIQVFYSPTSPGLYRNLLVIPTRDEVVGPDGKVTREGLIKIMRALGLRPRNLPIRQF